MLFVIHMNDLLWITGLLFVYSVDMSLVLCELEELSVSGLVTQVSRELSSMQADHPHIHANQTSCNNRTQT